MSEKNKFFGETNPIDQDEPAENFKEQILKEQIEYDNYKKQEIMYSGIIRWLGIIFPLLFIISFVLMSPLLFLFFYLSLGTQVYIAHRAI